MTSYDQSRMKLGRLPARHDRRTLHLSDYIDRTALPAAPAEVDWTSNVSVWGMALNDKIGDCTCAAAAHQIESWTADAGHEDPIPDNAVLTAYEAVSGYNPQTGANDNGAVELDVLNYWRRTGVGGHKIGAFTKVAPTNHTLVNDAIWLFGGVYIGLALPVAAQNMGALWDRPVHATGAKWKAGSWGGHAVIALSYDAKTRRRKVITWGQVVEVTERFWDHYVEEVWAIISVDFIRGGKSPAGFNAAQLAADLQQVGAPSAGSPPLPSPPKAPAFTGAWLLATLEQAAGVFALAFLAPLVLAGAGAFNLSALHGALIAAGVAVLSFIESTLATTITPGQTNVATALRARRAR